MTYSRPGCPHARVEHCPLYVAGHVPNLPTCLTGAIEEGCSVQRGEAVYDWLLGALEADTEGRRLVAERKWQEATIERQEQRLRNFRAAGIH